MKIYFTASIRGKQQFGKYYQTIYKKIEEIGHTLLDDVIIQPSDPFSHEDDRKENVTIFQKATKFIKACDVVILEVSVHSLSMGYVMRQALDAGKPVIALYLAGNIPYFAMEIEDEKLQVLEYTEENLGKALQSALDYAQEKVDTRFNFFIPASMMNYLDTVSQKEKIPRSVYLRRLIEKDMRKNKEYLE